MVSDRQDGAATAAPSDKKTGENYFDESGEYLSDADSLYVFIAIYYPYYLATSHSFWPKNQKSQFSSEVTYLPGVRVTIAEII
ncbi:hypothetical protein [Burkholderia glumae]